eukprot:SAG25_NODE_10006_length_349_cov_0.620000_1_plen_84_part_10
MCEGRCLRFAYVGQLAFGLEALAIEAYPRPSCSPAVSHFCACIGSPCLMHRVHGASIGGGGSAAAGGGGRQAGRGRRRRLVAMG